MTIKSSSRAACVVLWLGASLPASCLAQAKPKDQSQQSVMDTTDSRTTILPSSQGHIFFPTGTQYWTPTGDDVKRLEEDLPGLAKTSPAPRRHGNAAPRSITTYYRQYIGILKNGRKCIYVNAFARPFGSEFMYWKQRAVFVYDGGDAFYHVTYDMQSRRFGKLQYNGYA